MESARPDEPLCRGASLRPVELISYCKRESKQNLLAACNVRFVVTRLAVGIGFIALQETAAADLAELLEVVQ